jgi:hypothetical protein
MPLLASTALVLALAPGAAPMAEPIGPDPEPAHDPQLERVRWRGTGALVVGSLAGAAGLGLGIGTARRFATLEACPECGDPNLRLPFATIALNTAAFTLIAAGAGLRGRDDGLRVSPTTPAPPGVTLGLGALFLGGGGVLVAGALTWRLLDASGGGTPWAILQGGMSMIVVGTGLIVHGTTYRKFAALRAAQVRVVPSVHWHHAGLALVGAF